MNGTKYEKTAEMLSPRLFSSGYSLFLHHAGGSSRYERLGAPEIHLLPCSAARTVRMPSRLRYGSGAIPHFQLLGTFESSYRVKREAGLFS